MFDVYFGEPGTDEPVSANNGGASYTYKTAGTYKIRVVSKVQPYRLLKKSDFVVTILISLLHRHLRNQVDKRLM
jgi:hypothetical protein